VSVMDWACAVIAAPSTIAPATMDVIDGFISASFSPPPLISPPPLAVELNLASVTRRARVSFDHIELTYCVAIWLVAATSPAVCGQSNRMWRGAAAPSPRLRGEGRGEGAVGRLLKQHAARER
jgi:hypothetical protein